MKTVLSYLLGIFLLSVTIFSILQHPTTTVLFLLASLLAIPFTFKLIEKYIPIKGRVKIIAISSLSVVGFFIIGQSVREKERVIQQQESIKRAQEYASIPQSTKDSINNENRKRRNAAIQERRLERIKENFSDVTGENYDLAAYIQQNLNEPESYEHVKTTWVQMDTLVVVYTTIRAKNGFGAKQIAHYEAVMSLDNKLLSIQKRD